MGCVLGCVRSRASSSVHVRGQAYLDELGHGEQAAAARSKVQRCVAMEVFEADECPAISEQLVARAGVPCVVVVVVSAMLCCQPCCGVSHVVVSAMAPPCRRPSGQVGKSQRGIRQDR